MSTIERWGTEVGSIWKVNFGWRQFGWKCCFDPGVFLPHVASPFYTFVSCSLICVEWIFLCLIFLILKDRVSIFVIIFWCFPHRNLFVLEPEWLTKRPLQLIWTKWWRNSILGTIELQNRLVWVYLLVPVLIIPVLWSPLVQIAQISRHCSTQTTTSTTVAMSL